MEIVLNEGNSGAYRQGGNSFGSEEDQFPGKGGSQRMVSQFGGKRPQKNSRKNGESDTAPCQLYQGVDLAAGAHDGRGQGMLPAKGEERMVNLRCLSGGKNIHMIQVGYMDRIFGGQGMISAENDMK